MLLTERALIVGEFSIEIGMFFIVLINKHWKLWVFQRNYTNKRIIELISKNFIDIKMSEFVSTARAIFIISQLSFDDFLDLWPRSIFLNINIWVSRAALDLVGWICIFSGLGILVCDLLFMFHISTKCYCFCKECGYQFALILLQWDICKTE